MKIVLNDEVKDTVTLEERQAKKGGSFEQYKLFLEDEHKTLRVANYLFRRQLNNLFDNYGEHTESWAGNYVVLKGVTDGDYFALEIEACAVPPWVGMKV